VASHLLSREALITIKKRLAGNGLLAINVTSVISGLDVSSIYHTLLTVFDIVRVFSPATDTHRLTSIVFIAATNKSSLVPNRKVVGFRQITDSYAFIDGEIHDLPPGTVISDNFNPLGYYRSGIRPLWTASMQRYFGTRNMTWLLF
jgi:spermidine synthase